MLKKPTRVLLRMASTSAPAGTWLAMAVIVPRLRAKPIAGLRPALGGQIDGDEGTEAGLDIGDEEVEQSRPRPRIRRRRRDARHPGPCSAASAA